MLDRGMLLPVMEMFYSIQGEGFNTGKAAFFIRIGGCDVGCHWCDVKEAWDASLHPLTTVDEIVSQVLQYPAQSVVITGGEPLMYNLDILCRKLKDNQIRIFLETSGTYPLSGSFDWICLSPKSQQNPRKDMLQLADELKVIVYDEDDFRWAEQNVSLVKEKCLLYLQPEWSRYEKILPSIVDFILNNPRWMFSLQSHKFMNIP
ncbi:MAG: 7-carboxy-7-deazaguanine synthase QueE [Bacteroidales bacterium]|nr:7-carboxy-7-deazaguanine synthase QueE [Bacteroidales bacterium]